MRRVNSVNENYAIGAFDRYNLGDLAFANVAQKYFKNLKYFSPFGEDFSHLKSVKSDSLKSIPKSGNYIFVGGEILSSSWYGAYMDIKKPGYRDLFMSENKYTTMLLSNLVKSRMKIDWKTPYIPNPENYKGKYIYLSVAGGTFVDEIMKLPSLQTYLSVRDKCTLEKFKYQNQEAILAPDSVSTLAFEHSDTRRTNNYRKLVIQCSYFWYKKNFTYLHTLIEDALREGMEISFCPFGYSNKHADQVAFGRISTRYPHVKLEQPTNLSEYIRFLKSNDLFIGTSLHGHIISSAIGLANMPLPGIPKIENYLITWYPEVARFSKDYFKISKLLKFLSDYSQEFDEKRIRMAREAERNILSSVEFIRQ